LSRPTLRWTGQIAAAGAPAAPNNAIVRRHPTAAALDSGPLSDPLKIDGSGVVRAVFEGDPLKLLILVPALAAALDGAGKCLQLRASAFACLQ
jgi:hypothetical protein